MKLYIKQIEKCADCPHEMFAMQDRGYCALTGKIMDGNKLPDWCPLEDVKRAQE